MKKLMLAVALVGCTSNTAPVEPTVQPYIRFIKRVDSLSIIRNTQTFKRLDVETNLPDHTKVIFDSDIWVRVRIGIDSSYITNRNVINWPWVDTISTVNCCSYTYKGFAKSMFGAFEMLRGQVATVIASTRIYGKLYADTMKIVMY